MNYWEQRENMPTSKGRGRPILKKKETNGSAITSLAVNDNNSSFIHSQDNPIIYPTVFDFSIEELDVTKPLDLSNCTIDDHDRETMKIRANLMSDIEWDDLELKPSLLKTLRFSKFDVPTRIQASTLNYTLQSNNHLIAQSQNGTGKTNAYLLTCLHKIDENLDYCQAIIVVPTRELALQIRDVAYKLAGEMKKFTCQIGVGGEKPICNESGQLASHLLVCCTGTLVHWALVKARRCIDLSVIKIFVLDEADQVIGFNDFKDTISKIKKVTDKNGAQYLLFSATYNDDIKELCDEMFNEKTLNEYVQNCELTLKNVRQYFMRATTMEAKMSLIFAIYRYMCVNACIIFCKTKSSARFLGTELKKIFATAETICGDMSPEERASAIERFREGKVRVLISTNLSSRGLDIDVVNLIINWDLPMLRVTQGSRFQLMVDPETYLHRVGRSGRLGRKGVAVSFCSTETDYEAIKAIECQYACKIDELQESELMNVLLEKNTI